MMICEKMEEFVVDMIFKFMGSVETAVKEVGFIVDDIFVVEFVGNVLCMFVILS